MIMKSLPSKALIIKINFVFLACFFIAYVATLLKPSTSVYHEYAISLVRCSLTECHRKGEGGIKTKAVLEEKMVMNEAKTEKNRVMKREKPSFLNKMGRGMKIGMVNMEDEDVSEWKVHGQIIKIKFENVSNLLKWKDLFPEWIDEEEEMDGTECPEIPMPDFNNYRNNMDMLVVKLPCKYPQEGWGKDVYRLQVNLVAANLAVKRGCRPMVDLFRCEELKKREGDWWYYKTDLNNLAKKFHCQLVLVIWLCLYGEKPWICYRDYDCNWDIGDQRVYASDVAHKTWWKLHDSMDESLQKFCGLTEQRKIELQWDRKMAGKIGFKDEHWKINVTDPRQFT
ncbi:unnamed protein product [Withania somnifera]